MKDIQVLDDYLKNKIEEKRLPGAAVSIRGPEGFSFGRGYGVRDVDMTTAPDENTIFGIASMGKSMVALCCAILTAEGKMSLDDPVCKYVAKFRVPGNPKDAVTVRHLAMHTAGIPPMEPLEWSIAMNTPGRKTEWGKKMQESSPNKMDTIDDVVDYIANCPYPTLGSSGEYMSYSNEGYAVLCYVVDAAAGMPLEQFLKERVYGPMGMTRTVLDIDGSEARKIASDGNITALFDPDEEHEGKFLIDEQWSILPPFRGCACVKSTAHDMARYYQCLSNGGKLDGEQVIPAKAVDLMIGSGYPAGEKDYYCLGLNKRMDPSGHIICGHSGGLHGVSSEGGLFLGEDYGFAVLCNEEDADVTDLIWALYNWVLDLPLDTPHHFLHPVGRDFSDPEMLIGSYICHEGVPVFVKVFVEDGKLIVDKDGTRLTPVYCGETWFQLRDGDGNAAGRMFFYVKDSKAWGVKVYTRIYQRIEE